MASPDGTLSREDWIRTAYASIQDKICNDYVEGLFEKHGMGPQPVTLAESIERYVNPGLEFRRGPLIQKDFF